MWSTHIYVIAYGVLDIKWVSLHESDGNILYLNLGIWIWYKNYEIFNLRCQSNLISSKISLLNCSEFWAYIYTQYNHTVICPQICQPNSHGLYSRNLWLIISHMPLYIMNINISLHLSYSPRVLSRSMMNNIIWLYALRDFP